MPSLQLEPSRQESPAIEGPHVRIVRRRSVALVSAVAAAAAMFVTIPTLLPDGSGTSSARAAEFLRQQSAIAGTQPTLRAGAGEYYYFKNDLTGMVYATADGSGGSGPGSGPGTPGVCHVLITGTEELWLAPNGAGRQIEAFGPDPTYPSDVDHAECRQVGLPHIGGRSDHEFGPRGMPVPDVTTLPTTRDGLADALQTPQFLELLPDEDRTLPLSPDRMLSLIAGVLPMPQASAQLRSALFDLAASLPTVAYVGPTMDAVGRTGIAIAVASSAESVPTRLEVIIDPDTSELLEQTQTVAADTGSWPAGTVLRSTVTVHRAVVDATGHRPEGA